MHNAAKAYNKLPRELKSIKSNHTFVKKLRNFLLEKCYNSLEKITRMKSGSHKCKYDNLLKLY
jgi:hypothetical protein